MTQKPSSANLKVVNGLNDPELVTFLKNLNHPLVLKGITLRGIGMVLSANGVLIDLGLESRDWTPTDWAARMSELFAASRPDPALSALRASNTDNSSEEEKNDGKA